jgi:hypothetical protein
MHWLKCVTIEKVRFDHLEWGRLQPAAVHANDLMLAHGFHREVDSE